MVENACLTGSLSSSVWGCLYFRGLQYIVIRLQLNQCWSRLSYLSSSCGAQCVRNSAGHLCGLHSPIEEGDTVRPFLEAKKMEETLPSVVVSEGFVEIEGIWGWQRLGWMGAVNLKSVKPEWGRSRAQYSSQGRRCIWGAFSYFSFLTHLRAF